MVHNTGLLSVVKGFESGWNGSFWMEGAITGLYFNPIVSLLLFAACVQTAFTVNAHDIKILSLIRSLPYCSMTNL